MLNALRKALTQLLTDPRLWKLVIFCVLISLVCFAALWGLLGGLLQWLAHYWPRFQTLLTWGGWTVSFVAALLLFPTTFVLVQSLFQESVADRVEEKYYSQLPPADGAPFWTSLWRGLRFFIIMLSLNLGAAPLYFGMAFLLGSGAIIYALLNGWLSGREYYEVVAHRRLAGTEVDASRKQNWFPVFLTGLAITLLGMVPIINLLAPIWGAAAMVHIFHDGERRNSGV